MIINTKDFTKKFNPKNTGKVVEINEGMLCPEPDCNGTIQNNGESLYCDDENCPLMVWLDA